MRIMSENAFATITRKDGEFQVVVRSAGVKIGVYFTDDRGDAIATARAELTRIEADIEASTPEYVI